LLRKLLLKTDESPRQIPVVSPVLSQAESTLIDELIRCWSAWDTHEVFYLEELAPKIAQSSDFDWLPQSERTTVVALRSSLDSDAWARLPELIAMRRSEHRESADAEIRLEGEREAARVTARNRAREIESFRQELLELCSADFLRVDDYAATRPALVQAHDVQEIKAEFVHSWFARPEVPPELRLDVDQSSAVAAGTGDVQVVARAGSGKTRTIAARALFLIDHCGVPADDILLIAFNRDAAAEMKKRLASVLEHRLPHVMTFHALAHAIVHPNEDLLFDDPGGSALGLSREIQEVIDEHLRSRETYAQMRRLMLANFRDDWERIARGGFELPKDELLALRRSLPRETLNGEQVKSYGEKVIANALFEHAVPYKYERSYRWGDQNYRPDFTIFLTTTSGVILEYFGLAGDSDYDEMSARKREFWTHHDGWTLIECTPNDLSPNPGAFVEGLMRRLAAEGVPVRRRTEDEIWELVRKRALDHFTKAMKNFVGRARKRNLSDAELRQLVAEHAGASESEQLFTRIGSSVYAGYLARIKAQGEEDFDGLVWRAVRSVQAGQTSFVRARGVERGNLARVRYVMVDEFQDLSPMFFELLAAIRSQNATASFFGVGDDFQAINGFAGADLDYFTEFRTHFRRPVCVELRNNYRSAQSIVKISNQLMTGRGAPAAPSSSVLGRVAIAWLDRFVPSVIEGERHAGDDITPAMLRLVADCLGRGDDVAILSRTNYVPWYVDDPDGTGATRDLVGFVEHLRSLLPEETRGGLTASTVHSYKGMEQQVVVVLDALEGRFPLIHPNWVFMRLFGDTLGAIEDEERRLFYVALTRAKSELFLVSEHRRVSPFLEEIVQSAEEVDLNQLSTVMAHGPARLEVRVYGAFDVKDYLKAVGYRFHGHGRYWARSVAADGFDLATLLRSDWTSRVAKLDVLDEAGVSLIYQSELARGARPGDVLSVAERPGRFVYSPEMDA
jgi:DNA helicase-4